MVAAYCLPQISPEKGSSHSLCQTNRFHPALQRGRSPSNSTRVMHWSQQPLLETAYGPDTLDTQLEDSSLQSIGSYGIADAGGHEKVWASALAGRVGLQ